MIRHLDMKAMCEKLGGTRPLHPATIHRAVQAGTLPPPIKFGRVARWREDEVDAVLQRLADARD
jgi:predicted DNA-binding transcriptional regulator AlpA